MTCHSYSTLTVHLVWSTHKREPIIEERFKQHLYNYIGLIASRKGWHLLAVGGINNHIHILIRKGPQDAESNIVCRIKTNSSKFVRDVYMPSFRWQEGYAAFPVESSNVQKIKNYILNQEVHHKNESFDDELLKL